MRVTSNAAMRVVGSGGKRKRTSHRGRARVNAPEGAPVAPDLDRGRIVLVARVAASVAAQGASSALPRKTRRPGL